MEYSDLWAPVFLAGVGTSLAAVLAWAGKKLAVEEPPHYREVRSLLPGANCGACGQPGCQAFAMELAAGRANPGGCTVNAPETNQVIADLLGIRLEVNRQVARLACHGGLNVAAERTRYEGSPSCVAAATVEGGSRGCAWGCLGLGDCADVCDFGAITMSPWSLPEVDTSLCTACGDCVDICPKDLFSIEPLDQPLWVACRNELDEDQALAWCQVACTGCGLCARDAPPGVLEVKGHLVHLKAPELLTGKRGELKETIARCPTGAIGLFQTGQTSGSQDKASQVWTTGPAAKRPAAHRLPRGAMPTK